MLLWIFKILLYIPISILHPTRIKGKKNLPKGKAILACNHYSNWDIALYILNTKRRIKILAKKELFKNKAMGGLLKNFGAICIDRESSDINAIKLCMKALKDGQHLFIFPEGTRLKNENEVLGEIKSGMSLIAIKTKTPVVPIWVERKPKLFRKSVYHIGLPFEFSEFYGKKLDDATLELANQFVREKMIEVREEYLKQKLLKKKSV